MLFGKKSRAADETGDFSYLSPEVTYLDAACQTLRPQCVIDAEHAYYTQYNACGGRVKYRWGQEVDAKVAEARRELLAYAGKSPKEYTVAFTLNTTYGINLVLHQLPSSYKDVVTTDIEHNSVFLPTMTFAKSRGGKRTVLRRSDDGSVDVSGVSSGSVVVLNSMSNIDGRRAVNLPEIAQAVHTMQGMLLVDGAQGFGHDPELLRATDFDAAFGSAHKMYGPSLGFIIIRTSLLRSLQPFFIGGGTVKDVREDAYDLLTDNDDVHAPLEPGLQSWGAIIGFGAALQWLSRHDDLRKREHALSEKLFEGLSAMPRVHLLNRTPSSVTSFHVDGIDAHRIALFLSEKDIMCRSGHFCCHSYLQHQCKLPPLLRASMGLYSQESDVERFLAAMKAILTAF